MAKGSSKKKGNDNGRGFGISERREQQQNG